MLPSPVLDVKAFVPARDPELSKAFYTDLGFTINFSNDEFSELQIGSFRFLLQKFYVPEHAGNFMMALNVEDADAWWEHIHKKDFKKKYPGIMCKPPAMQPWGLRVLYLSILRAFCGTSLKAPEQRTALDVSAGSLISLFNQSAFGLTVDFMQSG